MSQQEIESKRAKLSGLEERKLTLKIKSKQSQSAVLRGVSTKITVEQLLKLLSAETGFPPDRIIILHGYPPVRLSLNLSALVETLPLNNQDVLIVECDVSAASVEVMDIPSSSSFGSNPRAGTSSAAETRQNPGSSSNSFMPIPFRNTSQNQLIINALNSSTMRDLDSQPNVGTTRPSQLSVASSAVSSATTSSSEESLPVRTTPPGLMLRQVVPSDNSCLFTSVCFALAGSMDLERAGTSPTAMRNIIATAVMNNPVEYNKAFLGRPNRDYVDWIRRPESWGGGIELSVLSGYFDIEMVVVDIQSLLVSRFGEDRNHAHRIFLLYDGIHYDPLYYETFDGTPNMTVFPTREAFLLDLAVELGREAQAAHQFTDLSNFALMCRCCNTPLRGQHEAQLHCKDTGHTEFSETKK